MLYCLPWQSFQLVILFYNQENVLSNHPPVEENFDELLEIWDARIREGFEPTLDFALQRKRKNPNTDILFINFKKVKKRLKI